MSRKLQVPEGEDKPLLQVANWPDSVFDQFLEAIEAQASAASTTALAKGVATLANDDVWPEWEDVVGTITAISKAALGIGRSPSAVSEDIAAELVEDGFLPEDSASKLRERLTKLLGSSPVLTAAQADMFLSLRGQVARRVQISTQLEPIYASDKDRATPTGFFVLQELSIETASTNDERVDVFSCILELDDLRLLQEAVAQAVARRARLESMLNATVFQFKTAEQKETA